MGGRMMIEAAIVGVPDESRQTDHFKVYMTENTMVCLVALLSALICIVGFLSVFLWIHLWRSRDDHAAAGVANIGLKETTVEALSSVVYDKLRSEQDAAVCPICLSEFMEGEKLRMLPKCKHSFHMECVNKWLLSHLSCPTCRHCILDTEAHGLQCCSNLIQCSRSEATLVQVHVPRPLVEGDQCIDCGV